ncbi:glycosyltransferase family 2 protein [Humisphaera borealis]|uniref:Glycosyltransferase n=1 Tax=Humisphaera borealis TaxID=2807512 RepID=A0A7M2WW42_9BACT|nr:glycosyltransferase [Humisphaera borealis]QOV89432.1 glycosyltransferase [Humisphaera borealis]
MKLSYVIVTRNRCQALLRTLDLLERNTGLPRHSWEVIVIDNASDDDTVSRVARLADRVRLVRLDENEGIPARNRGLPLMKGKYVVFLDDDSYPMPGAIPAALQYLAKHTKTAGLVARVVLPDGTAEAPAFPAVTIGGATVLRSDIIRSVGGFAPEFFRQAEEYDLSFRLWAKGYKVERFEDIVFGHDKVPGGRSPALVHRMDLRNNLILVERYLPRPLRKIYRHEFIQRYAILATSEGHHDAANAALHDARVWARREAKVGRKTLTDETVEKIFELGSQARAVSAWAKKHAIRTVAIADWSKNIYATWNACRAAGLQIVGVAENSPAFAGKTYRGAPVLRDDDAAYRMLDGVVLSTISPAKVGPRMEALVRRFAVPTLPLWQPRFLAEDPSIPQSKRISA